MKLEILIPQYNETDEVIKPLLDSLAIQQNVNLKDDIRVIIVNDGSDIKLSESLLTSYPFEIKYIQAEHKGVSAARNRALDEATADYVMFCDADDMFFNVCGLYILFTEMKKEMFDTMTSLFIEETRHPETKEVLYVNREMDSTFVHGKVHRLKFLKDNNIRWNDSLTVHEDSYFNCLCQKLARKGVKYCPTPFYLWKWRDNSVCRHDPKYILKTYNNMLDSNTALVEELLSRNLKEFAQTYIVSMIFDAYYLMNKKEWLDQENQMYRIQTEKRFKIYYLKYKDLYKETPELIRNQIIVGIRNRFFGEGLMLESITFEDWINKEILPLEIDEEEK
jgi:glycosyltransferase involved in cell wall biosynthesis